MAKASIAINRPESSDAIGVDGAAVSLFFETLAEIGMSDKEAAYTMAMDPAQLSRVKSSQARLPFDAIWRLPDRFWAVFGTRLMAARGISEASALQLKAARIAELVKLLVEVA